MFAWICYNTALMKIPELKQADKYTGLYVVDFGDYCSIGFTAQEVAELVESEKYRDIKVFKVHRAEPDGTLELSGVNNEIFQLESGMFFFATDSAAAKENFKRLQNVAVRTNLPCRAKMHLAKYGDGEYVTALIYPAEYDGEVSRWLLDRDYRTHGAVEGGIAATKDYYDRAPEILERQQLFAADTFEHRSGDELLANLKAAVQR